MAKGRKAVAGDPTSDAFLESYAWRRLRMQVIRQRGRRCECCGASPVDGKTVINVDHIKPRKAYPELALAIDNLQVLCSACNHGKGNWDETDWRDQAAPRPRLVRRRVVAPPEPDGAVFTVTRQWLEAHATNRMGWTSAQVRALGVTFRKGWKSAMIGQQITPAQRMAFEAGKNVTVGKSQKRRKQSARLYEQFKPMWS